MNLNNIVKDYPDTTTPINKTVLENVANAILNVAFPIGKTEIFYDNNDHSEYLGFTWVRTSTGKTPVGIDSSDTDFNEIGKIIGSKNHVLTTSEMPNNFPKIALKDISQSQNEFKSAVNTEYTKNWILSQNNSIPVGGGNAISLQQPSMVFAFWRRTA